MSSLKMTFSLASLVLLIAFGLVFGTAPVMAHEDASTSTATPRPHDHPLREALSANTGDGGDGEAVQPHGHHPRVTISPKAGDNVRGGEILVVADDTTTGTVNESLTTFIVDFNQDVNGGATVGTAQTADATSVLTDTDFMVRILNNEGATTASVFGTGAGQVEVAEVRRVMDDDSKFEVDLTFGENSIPNGTEDDPLEKLSFRIQVEGGEAWGLQTVVGVDEIPGASNYASSTLTATLVTTLTPVPTVPAVGTLTGKASLTDDFEVTVTFDKAVAELESGDFNPVNCELVAGSLYADPSAAVANTVWKATFHPLTNPTTQNVSVTLQGTKVKPVADDTATTTVDESKDGIVELVRLSLASIAVPADANDEAAFVATLTFTSKPLQDPVANDIKVTPVDDPATTTTVEGAVVGDVAAMLGSDGKVWQVEITPLKGMATKIELSDTGKAKFGASTATATAPVKGAPPPAATPSIDAAAATYAAATATAMATTTITETEMLAANGFAVIGAGALPDIQRFFAEGGSISVLSSLTGAEAKSVVISEIMWGLNLRAIGAARTEHQFIELYNTSGAAIDLTKITLTFDGANTPPAAPTGMVLLDQVSNVSGVGWVITDAPGQSGRTTVAADTTFVPSDLVSMYRSINYVNVKSTTLNKDDAAKNRVEQLKAVPGGNAIGSWAASNAADTYGVNLIGSPGAQHFVAYATLTSSTVDRSLVIINEIGNHGGDDKYDWVELRNVSSGEVNLKKWELSQVTKDKKDSQLVSFPDNDNHKIAAGDVLLIVNSDPYRDPSHPIAAGTRINGAKAETTGLKGESRYYVDGGLELANTDDTLLILRSANDKEGKPEAFKDVVGTLSIVDNAASLRTSLWPLRATNKPHDNVVDGDKDNKQDDFRAGIVYKRGDASGGTGEKDLARVGYTGVGYKRSAAKSNQNGGTPGYPNGAVIDTDTLADAASVTISEVMYVRGRNLPQWIELYNSSTTQAVNLNEWKLKLENADDVDIRTTVTTNNLGGTIIPPNQTVLIVSSTTGRVSRAAQGGIDFPASRVIDMWGQKDKLEVATGLTRRTYRLLSQTAFKITLIAKGGAAADVVGNLGADGAAMWALPMLDPEESEGRSSIIRRYDEGVARAGTMAPPGDGTGAWVLASESALSEVRFNETFYGSPDDVGTPGYHGGGALPVSLSKFRPERLKDTGAVVIRWITESELNNAGFNILRSEKRDGEFTKLNTKLIAGQGTTSERTTYEYADTSAKPNVVYYYQIQDVSLDGKVQTLRQSRLKGNVSAAGKITTTWGELKALQ